MAKRKMSLAQKINVLRAGVMGANDGILSVAGIVVGGGRCDQQQLFNFNFRSFRITGRDDFNVYG